MIDLLELVAEQLPGDAVPMPRDPGGAKRDGHRRHDPHRRSQHCEYFAMTKGVVTRIEDLNTVSTLL